MRMSATAQKLGRQLHKGKMRDGKFVRSLPPIQPVMQFPNSCIQPESQCRRRHLPCHALEQIFFHLLRHDRALQDPMGMHFGKFTLVAETQHCTISCSTRSGAVAERRILCGDDVRHKPHPCIAVEQPAGTKSFPLPPSKRHF